MKEHEKSRVWLFGDNVNTDLMSPGYTWNMEWSEAKKHILVNHPRFAPEVREGDIIVAGDNFGCGSSREHAALVPLYLGIKAVLAKSFARIHKANLINSGILPLVFENPEDYDALTLMEDLIIENAIQQVKSGRVAVKDAKSGQEMAFRIELTDKELQVLLAGGKINFIRQAQ